jgi:hypothetical protein
MLVLEGAECFVVNFLELWFESALCEESKGTFVGGKNFGARFALHGFDVDGVAFVIVKA